MEKPAIVLASGGVDSTTAMAIARAEWFDVYALTISYDQRHARELGSARRVAQSLGARAHLILNVELGKIGGSALTGDIAVPMRRTLEEIGRGIPSTYVPVRNTVFLALATAWAEVPGAEDVFIGANVVEYSGYPDCRPEYLEAFERLAILGTKAGIEGGWRLRIHAPLVKMTKAEIIKRGLELGVDYALTWSCYSPMPSGAPCGSCDSCLLRAKGFAEAGVHDPLLGAAG